ncbi:CbaC protein [Halostella litorea]|uniref:CbaC protein n=1 Tax=Halostella litorea TaxID=2528831 RepID=UPI00109329E0|nr:CbaC protein [Halostella litorea]
MRLTRGGVLVLAAVSLPIVLELRTLFGFFAVELPLAAVAGLELLALVAILVAYDRTNASAAGN